VATGFRLSAPNEYRRGVVLGLTLAEVLILLVFLLLLTMTALLLRKDRENTALGRDAEIATIVKSTAASQGVAIDNDSLANLIRDGAQDGRLRSELSEARQQAAANAKVASDEQALASLLERVPGQPGETPAEKLSRVMSQVDANARAADDDRALASLLERVPGSPGETSAEKLTTVVGQNVQMRNELLRLHGNGGSGLPYCWTLPSGQPQYMLMVDMHDDGVIVSDFSDRPRPDDPAWLTLDGIARGQIMPIETFISEVSPLKGMEAAQRCRYAIQALDSTARTNKPGYKLFMGRLWSVFQVQEVHR